MTALTGRAWIVELRKAASTPALVVALVLAMVSVPLSTLVVVNHNDPSGSLTAVRIATSTVLIPIIVFGLWGSYATTVEYEQGAIVGSLLAVPRRSAFYLAKVAAVASVTATSVTLSLAGAVLVVLAATPAPGRATGQLWVLPLVGLVAAGVAAVGVAVGFLLRGSLISAIALVLALLGPQALGPALGVARRWVLGSGPGSLVSRAVGGSQGVDVVGWPTGAAILLCVVAITLVAGWRVFARADH
ncbi:hypothetical protein [Gordonia sp. (in: high G+C Gram-positive bacteria)]|uniref:hypothetical protein n=1 Tax=Gordonia sp. (in: high G+C Gram-positive bacteria) TaxID=84139 RepID=UPI0039E4AFA5